jgi:hypothetical protein
MEIIKTDNQRKMEAKHAKICRAYKALREKEEGVSEYAILRTLSVNFEMTVEGIRQVLIKNDLYKSNEQARGEDGGGGTAPSDE